MKETKSKIFEAAQAVFLRKGLEAATMSDIAKEACISRPSLHYYHRTKHGLFSDILAKAVKDIISQVQPVVDSDLSLLKKAEKTIDIYHEILLENPLMPLFLISEARRNPQALLELLYTHGHIDVLVAQLHKRHAGELHQGRLPLEAMAHFLNTFCGLLFFPFLAKPLLDAVIFRENPTAFKRFVEERREIILRMLSVLVKPTGHALKKK
jgi:AcrR family transcriptional regulator